MLTKKQHDLLVFIQQRLTETGVSPSFDEMKDALDLKSKSGIHRLISGLEERGFIRRLANRARALEILRPVPALGGDNTPAIGANTTVGSTINTNTLSAPENSEDNTNDNSQTLPLYGRIAAGTPIEAIQDASNTVTVPTHLLGRGEYYALEVDGQSMIEAGILDGDTVIIERTQTARNGDVVVALVDNEEATLKTFRQQSGTILLEPANRDYETQLYDAGRVKIQGRLAGLVRLY